MIAEDVLVFGQGHNYDEAVKDHDTHLLTFLRRAEERGLKINAQKFKYRLEEVSYAGHVLTHQVLKVDSRKIEALQKMEEPTDVARLRRFLGTANYLGRFVKNLADICEPLQQLTKQEIEWQWAHEQATAFKKVKEILTTAPILAFFDPKRATTLQCDASKSGLGAALLQGNHVIAYASRALSETEKNYAQIEKELLSVVFGLQKFDQYVYGREVCVDTDHKPLIPITKKPILQAPKRLQRMLLQMQRYNVTLNYRRGKNKFIADTLSRATGHTTSTDEQTGFEKELETICVLKTSESDLHDVN